MRIYSFMKIALKECQILHYKIILIKSIKNIIDYREFSEKYK